MQTNPFPFLLLASFCLMLTIAPVSGHELPLWTMRYAQAGHATNIPVAMVADGSGNLYITGYTQDAGLTNGWVTLKYSSTGSLLWSTTYAGSTNGDQPSAIALGPSGRLYVTGYAYGTNSGSDFATVAYASDGNQLWDRRYNGDGNGQDLAKAIAVDASGNVYVAGTAYLSSSGGTVNTTYITIKYDPDGNQLWLRSYAQTLSNQDAQSLVIDHTGNVYVGGISVFFPDPRSPGFGYKILKYGPDGTQLAVLSYGTALGNGISIGITLAIGPTNEVYAAGNIWRETTFVSEHTVLKFTNNTLAWASTDYGANPYGTEHSHLQTMAVDSQGNVIFTGNGPNLSNITECVTMKFDPNGTKLWGVTHNRTRTNNEYARAMAIDPGGRIYVSAWSKGPANSSAFATLKYSPAGSLIWEAKYEGPSGGLNEPKAIAAQNGCVIVTGASESATGLDFVTICYPQKTLHVTITNGLLSFRATTEPGSLNWLQVSTDLKNWDNVCSGLADADGICIFPDQTPNAVPAQEFYRVISE